MKKVIKGIIIFFSVLILIFIFLLAAPFIFKDQLIELAKVELNKMLLAKVEFSDLKLSFVKNFPDAYIALENLKVTGTGNFEDELLASFDIFSVTVDIMSVIKMDNIEVKSILLDRARLNGHILEDGSANWDIVKQSEPKEKDEDDDSKKPDEESGSSDPFQFKVGLNKFEIRNLQASFRDDKNKMNAELEALNFTLHGDMKKENVDLNLKLAIDGADFWMNGVRLANKVNVGFISQVAADLKNLDFIIKDNKLNINEIVLKLDGSAGIKGKDINADVKFATETTEFKSLLSLVPAIYMNSFSSVQTSGSLDLSGRIKGTYNENMMPSADVNLSVNNAWFKYPDLPKSVDKINIAIKAHYDGEVFDRTTADIDRFNFEISGNPFAVEVHARTPQSDPFAAAKFAGKINIDSITDIIPVEDMKLSGLLECDIAMEGNLSTIQNEKYEDFTLDGHLGLSKFIFESPAFPFPAAISSINLKFSPRRVELVNLDAVVGSTDAEVSGSLENFIPFVLKNETIRGTLVLKSNNIDLNEFMGGQKEEKEESGTLSVIEVPKNVDFALTVNIGKIIFDKLFITDTAGEVIVKDGRLDMKNLGMNLLEGSMVLNGEYNTQNIAKPFINFDMNINQFNVTSALSSFSFLENIIPDPHNFIGKVSAQLTLHSMLTEHLSPELNSINSNGRIQTNNLQINNSPIFTAVADFTKNEMWRNPTLNNLNIGFEIKEGRLYINDPIVINMPPSRIEMKGDQGLDMTMNYRLDASMPVSAIGSGAADLLNKIPGGTALSEVKLTGFVRGNVKNPDITLSVADMANTIIDAAKEQVKEIITEKVDEVKTQVNEEINRQIDQLMDEAKKQADNVRKSAKTAADKVRHEANTGADKLIKDAGTNVVQKMLAEAAADALRKEGEDSAKKLEQEGERQARALIAEAEKKADDLRRQ